MRALDVEKMESSSNIDLRHVLWWKFIKNACRLRAPITARLSKEKCISLAAKRKPSHARRKQNTKNTLLKVQWCLTCGIRIENRAILGMSAQHEVGAECGTLIPRAAPFKVLI
jgi:hypothetical protein